MASFGTPLDVTVAELAIESFFPADPATGAALRDLVAAGPPVSGPPGWLAATRQEAEKSRGGSVIVKDPEDPLAR